MASLPYVLAPERDNCACVVTPISEKETPMSDSASHPDQGVPSWHDLDDPLEGHLHTSTWLPPLLVVLTLWLAGGSAFAQAPDGAALFVQHCAPCPRSHP